MALDMSQETALIEAVRAVATTEIMPRFRRPEAQKTVSKSTPYDLVTLADQRAEAVLTEAMASILPNAVVIGEEASEDGPALPRQIADAPQAVIIDPIDGTWNFAAGLCTFGVILAVTEAGQTVFGLLYDPVMDDWVLARKNGGCWYVRPGQSPQRLQVQPEAPEATGFLTLTNFPKDDQVRIATRLPDLGRVGSLHCSCHEYRMMGLGKSRFCLGYTPKAWDHAAGHLAVVEAGGVARHLDGRPYQPGVSEGPLLAAASEELFERVAAVIIEKETVE